MLERLGKVLFWAGCILAALVVAAGLIVIDGNSDPWFYAVLTVTIAGICFLLGRAARYVLSGY